MLLTQRALLVTVVVPLVAFAPCGAAAEPPPAITVQATYAGANCQVVADTVAAPIEQQVDGVKDMVFMRSRCTNDGRYTLTVTFKPREDLKWAQVLVQNRVALAQALLPAAVNRQGLTVEYHSPGVLLLVGVSSPSGRMDTLWLGGYASLWLDDELSRLPGVARVVAFGQRDYSLRVWLDPKKLEAHTLTVRDVIQALQAQNLRVEAEPVRRPTGKEEPPVGLTLRDLGRIADGKALGEVVLKTDGREKLVRVKDVARVEMAPGNPDAFVLLDGKPAVLRGVYPSPGARPREVSKAVSDRVSRIRSRDPEDVRTEVAFDFAPNWESPARPTTAEYLLLDLALPLGASSERTDRALEQCASRLRKIDGVRDVVALTDDPFDRVRDRPIILVRLAPAAERRAGREEVARTIRTRLGEIKDLSLRVRDLSVPGAFPRCGYPIDLAVCGPEAAPVRKWAETLVERLSQSEKLTDVWADRDSTPRPALYLDIDRTQVRDRGVAINDVFQTLEGALGSLYVNDFDRFGRTWQVQVQLGARPHRAEDLRKLKIRTSKGDMVPLEDIAKLREVMGLQAVDRLNSDPMVEITANPAAGLSAAEARKRCVRLAEEVRQELRLPKTYRLTWLQEQPAP